MNRPELTLFSTDAQSAGFRLDRFEVFNWGAFDQREYVLDLKGENALLMGANGAGKTTLVDALITLLNPTPERFYNQSAGFEDRKRQRRTEDYVLGVYGQSATGKERLRGTDPEKGTYTVLLGLFSNRDLNQVFTIAHFYWVKNEQLQKRFYTAPVDLNIRDHFAQFSGDIRDFNNFITKKCQGRAFDSFSEYAQDFTQKLCLRTPEKSGAGRYKPLHLFAKTAGIKVLGNLDEFIRQNMLDEADFDEDFNQLKKEYADIADIQQSLDKANRQEQMLMPLLSEHTEWLALSDDLRRAELARRAVTPWFARRHCILLHDTVQELEEKLQLLENGMEASDSDLKKLRQDEKELDFQIRQNEAGQRFEQLERERRDAETLRKKQEEQAKRYAALAEPLGLIPDPPDPATFFAQKHQLVAKAAEISKQLDEKTAHRDQLVGEKNKLDGAVKEIGSEIESLRSRRNNLPSDLVNIRERLCQALGIAVSELPFVGELAQVKEEERTEWLHALEKLLSPFSSHLLVPTRHLRPVSQWVRANDLGALFRFTEADDMAGEPLRPDLDPAIAANKLEVLPKSESPFSHWLRSELDRRYPHYCTSDLAEYERRKQSLTPEGLQKNLRQHQKDDRKGRLAQYVLGWNNEEKIRSLSRELHQAQTELVNAEQRIKPAEAKLADLNQKLADLARLNDFEKYDDLNFRDTNSRINEIVAELEELRTSSEQLKVLQSRLQEVKKNIEAADKRKTTDTEQRVLWKKEIETKTTQLHFLETDASGFDDDDPAGNELKPYVVSLGELDLKTIENAKKEIETQLREQQREVETAGNKTEKSMLNRMLQFKNPKKELLDEFPTWVNDVYGLPEQPSTEDVGRFTDILDRIQQDQLPVLRERYRERAGEDIVRATKVFQQKLVGKLADHEENVRNINQSLLTLPYSSDTYLRIVAEPNTHKGQVGKFRSLLDKCDYDRATFRLASLDEQQEILRETVQCIGQLIQQLDKDPVWRREVINVRNWLTFHTEEVYRHNGTPKPGTLLYGTGGRSGGEQAKLTYTVLAAALTYQFNISADNRNARSFRFIMIDEAFSKLDPENSTYLLDLLSSLNFQMLIITPNTNIRQSEKRMSHFIIVKKKNEMPPRSEVYVYSLMELLEKAKIGKKP